MATVSQAGFFTLQALTDLGALAVGGRIYTYTQGTTTKKNAYTEATGTTVHTYTSDGVGGEYIALNARGELPAPLYLTSGAYDITYKTAAGATVWTRRADPSGADLAGSGGSALVGFLQAGSGAVATTAQSKMRESVSVKDFGATGDGTTDDTAAIQLALDSGAKRVLFPKATYAISSPLLPKTQQHLIGQQRSSTIIIALAGFAGTALVNYPSGSYSGVTIENLLLNGNAIAARCLSMVGVSQGSVDQIILRDLQCSLATTTQVYLENLTYSDLDHLLANGGTDYVLHMKNCYTSKIEHGIYYNGTIAAAFIEGGSDVCMSRTTLFNQTGVPSTSMLKVDGGTAHSFLGCTFEPQGAGTVSQEVLLQDTITGVCVDHLFHQCQFVGTAGTKTRALVVGASGAVYKLVLDQCRFIKPTGNESILITNQSEMQMSRCYDLVTYDTATYQPVTFLNNSGNSVYIQNRLDQYVTLQTSGLLTANASLIVTGGSGATGYTKPLFLGSYALWVDSVGDLRIKSTAPSSDTDGSVVGTQT
jgi:hypothetical protein